MYTLTDRHIGPDSSLTDEVASSQSGYNDIKWMWKEIRFIVCVCTFTYKVEEELEHF